jgi:hypothetical protein
VALVAGTRLVNFQASAATLLSADLLRPQTELPSKLGRASAIYINKISMGYTHLRVRKNTKASEQLAFVYSGSVIIIERKK